MPSYDPIQKNSELIFYVALASRLDPSINQVNPTIAPGDATVSIDGGAFANLTTLPVVTPAGGAAVKVTLSAAEMNGDNIVVRFSDAAGGEWVDLHVPIHTSEDLYTARIRVDRDNTNARDEYTVLWFKNGVLVTSGITSPTIQVVKRADGTDLVASTAMTAVGSVAHKYDEATNRITPGEAVIVITTATIDGAVRTFAEPLGRDSA